MFVLLPPAERIAAIGLPLVPSCLMLMACLWFWNWPRGAVACAAVFAIGVGLLGYASSTGFTLLDAVHAHWERALLMAIQPWTNRNAELADYLSFLAGTGGLVLGLLALVRSQCLARSHLAIGWAALTMAVAWDLWQLEQSNHVVFTVGKPFQIQPADFEAGTTALAATLLAGLVAFVVNLVFAILEPFFAVRD